MAVYITGFLLALIGFIAGIMADHYLSTKSLPLETQENLAPEKGAYIKGLKYIISNEPDKAIAEFTRAVQINTNTVEIYINLGNLFREKGSRFFSSRFF
jgi:lipopolysaccharide biosynthesis regulator YciM